MSTATEAKPHLSATQITMLSNCGEQYKRRYVDGEIIPPGIALMKGGALHKGAETNMRQKLVSGMDLPKPEIVEATVAAFEAGLHGMYALTDEERSRGVSVVIGEAKDRLVEVATCHADEQAPDYQPVMVEETVRIELPGPRDILGIIDLADDLNRITDFKTASRRKRQDDADTNIQLSVYAAAFEVKMGIPPSEVRLDSIVQTKKSTSRQVLISQRSRADFNVLAARINAAAKTIEAGTFMPAAIGWWGCSLRFCGFARSCPFFNAERKALGDGGEE